MGGKEAKRKRALLRSGLDAEAAAAKAAEEFAEVRGKQQSIEESANKAESEAAALKKARLKRKRLAKEEKRKLEPSDKVKDGDKVGKKHTKGEAVDMALATETVEGASKQPKKQRKGDAAEATGKKQKGDPRLTVFVGQLPFTATAEDVEQHFSKAGIAVLTVRMLTEKGTNKTQNGTNKSKGMAFVQLGSEAHVQAALDLHQSELNGRWINVERSKRVSANPNGSDIAEPSASKEADRSLSVFVGQLPYGINVDSIREHFENSGVEGVTKVKMLSEKVTNRKGMAFVHLRDEESVLDALKLHDSQLGGRRIVVERSSKTEAKEKAAQASGDNQEPEGQ